MRLKIEQDDGQPVRFKMTEQTRQAVDDYIRAAGKKPSEGDADLSANRESASGAIAAVLGAYAITFPAAKVRTLVFFLFIMIVDLPALGSPVNHTQNPCSCFER